MSALFDVLVYFLLALGAIGIAFTTAQVLLAMAFLCRSSNNAISANTAGKSPRRRARDLTGRMPRVSILKPVSGIEDGLEVNLRSFASLAGPSYELIISVADPDDPAIPIIDNVVPLFSEGTVRVVIGEASRLDNPKVERLVAAAKYASGEILLISDSNVRVSSDYLTATLQEFEDARVGCAVNLFVADEAASLGALLECLYVLTFVLPGTILAASAGVTCVVGKSMALSRKALDKIGGFEAFANVLAEDQSIGLAVADAGYRVALSRAVVHNVVERRTMVAAVKRQVRWGKIRYSFSKLRYTTEFVCNPLPLLLAASLVCAIAGPSIAFPAGLLAASAAGARILQAATMRYLTGTRVPLLSVMLVPVQDCIQAAAQFIPYFSNHVDWRGFRTRLGRGTQILEPRRVINSGT
jgi:ceramide glucosyltransferase